MFSSELRRAAIETFVKYGHSYADAVAELGYPTSWRLPISLSECLSVQIWKAFGLSQPSRSAEWLNVSVKT